MRKQVKRSGCPECAVRLVVALAVSLGVVQLTGCVTPTEGIPIARDIEQNDIPVPQLYEFLGSETPDYGFVEGAAFRSWKGHYRGGGRIDDLVPWYIEEMNGLGWTFIRLEGEKEDKRLFFRKDNEAAQIAISRRLASDLKAYSNYVDAEIHPLGVEDYTVQANLDRFSSVQTTSYQAAPETGGKTTTAEPAESIRTDSEEQRALESERQRALREIEAIEES